MERFVSLNLNVLKNDYLMTTTQKLSQRLKQRAFVFFPALLTTCALLLSLESSESRAQPADGTQTLVFLRHAEKPAGGLGQLNCQGLNRAIDLAGDTPLAFVPLARQRLADLAKPATKALPLTKRVPRPCTNKSRRWRHNSRAT